ncbi:hypothetical protein EWM64_g118 [Hericium alpestre]|uniref:Uncharacterized protein n=1 Tax=Hericium alpestre TaxID=135208 RepID=A0A4Z0ACK9_9AGAM|nr:hypothetical protein EWM64_g118 [Hericium alpestre]
MAINPSGFLAADKLDKRDAFHPENGWIGKNYRHFHMKNGQVMASCDVAVHSTYIYPVFMTV